MVKFRKLFAAMAIIVAAVSVSANPIFSHKYTADPQPFVWNGRLYVYASFDNNNPNEPIGTYAGYDIRYYTLMSTDDMANWIDHGEVFSVKRDMSWANNCYAPGVAVRDGNIFLYVPDGGSSIGVVTADRPEGPFTDPNRRALVNHGTCTNCSVPWLFDPAAFIDDDGQAYLYFGGGPVMCGPEGAQFPCNPGPGENLRAIRLNDNMTAVSGNAATISGAVRSFEAAYMHKRNGIYYLSYVQNFDGDGADIAYMTGNSPMPPFQYRGKVIRNGTIIGWGNNHAAFIEYEDVWYAFYHDRRVKSANNPCLANHDCERRSVSVDILEYESDGAMREVVLTNSGPPQIRNFNPYAPILATTMNGQSGINTALCSAPNPGVVANDNIGNNAGTAGDRCVMLVSISDGDWIRLRGVDFGDGASKVIIRAASNSTTGGRIEFRLGSRTGTQIGNCEIASTGGWSTWRDFVCEIDRAASAGVQDFLYLVFRGTGEPFRLQQYTFEGAPIEPNEDGYFFHHTFEDGTTEGWGTRWTGAGEVSNSDAASANGERSLLITGRTEDYIGPAISLSTSVFVPGGEYSFSVLAMFADGDADEASFKLTLQYNLPGQDDAEYVKIDSVVAKRNHWVMLENPNFLIPEGASNIVFYVEMPGNATADFYIDDAMGGIANADAPGREGVTSVRGGAVAGRAVAQPMVSLRGRTLTVSPHVQGSGSELRVKVIDVRGRVRADFTSSGNARETFSLRRIPAGRYFVDVRGADGVRQVTPIVVR